MTNPTEKLDFVLKTIIETKSMVSSNAMYKTDFYKSDKGDNTRMDKEFLELLRVFRKLDIGIIEEETHIRPNDFAYEFYENGGFKSYYERLERESENLISSSEKEKERQQKKDRILDLDIKLKEFETNQGAQMKKWGFRILVINLIITITVLFLSQLINEKSESPIIDQQTHTEKNTKQEENQTLIKKDKDSLENETKP